MWQSIPDRVHSEKGYANHFSLMNYNEALNALNLQHYVRGAPISARSISLRNDSYPLHFVLPKWEEFVHNYNLRSGVSCITLPSCRTKLTQEFSLLVQLVVVLFFLCDTSFSIYILSPGKTDRQVVTSGRKLNLRRDLRWVAKRTRKFYRKYTQVAFKKKHFKAEYPLFHWLIID